MVKLARIGQDKLEVDTYRKYFTMDGHEYADQRENEAMARVIISFLKYEEYALKEIYNLRVKKWESISDRQKAMVPSYTKYLANLKAAIQENGKFFRSIAEYTMQSIS